MIKILNGDVREKIKELEKGSVNCIITSPPYWRLKDYGNEKQIGLEKTPDEFIKNLCDVFDECYRVLKNKGTLFVNLGDSYSGSNSNSSIGRKKYFKQIKDVNLPKNNCKAKRKSLVGIPAMFMLEMIKRGWRLRNKIIWHKPNAIPESVMDRFTNDYEEIFFFVKREKYYFNLQYEPYKTDWAEKYINFKGNSCYNEKGRRMRTVWSVNTQGIKHNHYASFPLELVRRCLNAGCEKGGTVLDIFSGTGTTLLVAEELGYNGIGIELNEEYIQIANKRFEEYRNKSKKKTRKLKKKTHKIQAQKMITEENLVSDKIIQYKLF